jgi:2-polyprenyl-6-methoxyphenol hydroxylase-like FAD-dependent oxidoreductase
MTSADAPAVVLGGGVAGLAAARFLARHAARVVVVERDVRPDGGSPEDAFTTWARDGVPQFRHSHAFLARLRVSLLAHLPDVLDLLREVGVREIGLRETAPPGLAVAPAPDDEDVVLLACRRATFEWALRARTRARAGIELREGVHVAGLVGSGRDGRRPRVTGVRLQDGSVLDAALVVDALGRRSPIRSWLAALGAPAPRERVHDSGVVYYTRFYRRRGGARAPRGPRGLVAVDLGWVKLALFPGDAGTFSITVGAPTRDATLRRLADPGRFERFLDAFADLAPWRGHAAPIHGRTTPVLVMGELKNRLRHFVDDDGPLAENLFVLGDAALVSNPIYGRGCTCALLAAELLDEALSRHPRDLVAAARHLHAQTEAHVRPFWDAAVASDRRMTRDRTATPTGALALLAATAEEAVGWFVERGLLPATRSDPHVFRGLLRVFHMLEPPERLMRDPELVVRAMPMLARGLVGAALPAPPFRRVPREVAVARLDAAS